MRLHRATLLGVLFAVTSGCAKGDAARSSPHKTDATTQQLAAAFSDSMASVTLISLDTAYTQGQPIRLVYFIANPGKAIDFNSDPGLIRLRVERLDGTPVEPSFSTGAVTGAWGPSAQVTLPTRGLVGRVVDLGCITTREVSMSGVMPECSYGFEGLSPGVYRAIVEAPAGTLTRRVDTTAFTIVAGR